MKLSSDVLRIELPGTVNSTWYPGTEIYLYTATPLLGMVEGFFE